MRFIRRYKSEIYGNYRRSALLYGSSIAVVMALYVLISSLVGAPVSSPETYVTDILMMVGIFVGTYRYRKGLAPETVSMKELLLLGLDTGIVLGAVYGLSLWVLLLGCCPEMVGHFADVRIAQMDVAEMSERSAEAIRLVRGYGAADWAFIGGFRSFVLSILFSFFASLVFGARPTVQR